MLRAGQGQAPRLAPGSSGQHSDAAASPGRQGWSLSPRGNGWALSAPGWGCMPEALRDPRAASSVSGGSLSLSASYDTVMLLPPPPTTSVSSHMRGFHPSQHPSSICQGPLASTAPLLLTSFSGPLHSRSTMQAGQACGSPLGLGASPAPPSPFPVACALCTNQVERPQPPWEKIAWKLCFPLQAPAPSAGGKQILSRSKLAGTRGRPSTPPCRAPPAHSMWPLACGLTHLCHHQFSVPRGLLA